MAAHSAKCGTSVYGPVEYGNALIHRARNEALAQMRPEADFILFVDDDMMPQPDTLERFIAHDAPVVSAVCVTREIPARYALKAYDPQSDQFAEMAAVRTDRPFTGQFGIGMAFTLIRRDVIEKLREYHLSAQDWLDENRRLLDRLKTRTEQREAERKRRADIRQARWERDKAWRVFDFLVTDQELQFGEDIALSRRLIALGIPVTIDGTCRVGHLGDYDYGPEDVDDHSAN